VIDRSGSMEGEKLKLVLQTLSFIIRQLQSKDKLAVVTYDDKVATPLGLTAMTGDGKSIANNKVKTIVAGNCTDLCSGLIAGIQVFEERTMRNEVSSLLLFTDGLANSGIQKTDEIIAEMAKHEPLTCSTYTFGFGSDHDPTLLKAISDKGNGIYSFITDKDTIASAFADCLGGLLSVVAQNIVITIQPLNGIIISKLNTTYKYEELEGVIILTIGDIQSEEENDLPKFEQAITPDVSASLAQQFELTKMLVPTQPHSNTQHKMPFQTVGEFMGASLEKNSRST